MLAFEKHQRALVLGVVVLTGLVRPQSCPSCQNGGSCTAVLNSPGQYQCQCPSAWQGVDCSIAVAAAPSQSPTSADACGGCLNGAICQQSFNSPGSYECQCNAGWSGTLCDIRQPVASPTASPGKITPTSCGSLTCQNNGTCNQVFNSPGTYECTCPAAWKGVDCTISNLAPSSPLKAAAPAPSSSTANSRNKLSDPDHHSFPRKHFPEALKDVLLLEACSGCSGYCSCQNTMRLEQPC